MVDNEWEKDFWTHRMCFYNQRHGFHSPNDSIILNKFHMLLVVNQKMCGAVTVALHIFPNSLCCILYQLHILYLDDIPGSSCRSLIFGFGGESSMFILIGLS